MKITFDGIRVNRSQFSTSCTVSPGINVSASSNYVQFLYVEHESRLWTRMQNCLMKIKANRKGTSPISALKILLLVNSFMQISMDIYNGPFTIKCCTMYDPTKALLYIYWLLMINTLFVEWISRQNQLLRPKYLVEETFNHLLGNEKDQLSPICSCGTWRLETPQYDDTQSQSIYKRTWKWGKTPERNSTLVNEFHQLAVKNLNVNAVQRSIAIVIGYSI